MKRYARDVNVFARQLGWESRGKVFVAGDFAVIETFETENAPFVYLWTYREYTGWAYTAVLEAGKMVEALQLAVNSNRGG